MCPNKCAQNEQPLCNLGTHQIHPTRNPVQYIGNSESEMETISNLSSLTDNWEYSEGDKLINSSMEMQEERRE